MKSLNKPTDQYQNLGYWFLLIVVMVVAGFYETYFITFPEPSNLMIHLHFVAMCLWIVLLIVQPFLIKYKKRRLHRTLGKVSYVVVPLVLFTTFMIALNRYNIIIGERTTANLAAATKMPDWKIRLNTLADLGLAIVYFTWLAIFYTLAMVNRKRSSAHARYILAAALTVTGPTVDRFLYVNMNMPKPLGISAEFISFLLIDLILLTLLIVDYKNKKPLKPLALSLGIYAIVQVLYYLFFHSRIGLS